MSMDETKRRLDLRAVLGVFAVVLAAGALWAASAFAGGGSPASERGSGDSPAAANVQSRDAPDHDCPERGGESEESSTT
jgi:nitrous oxide reductase